MGKQRPYRVLITCVGSGIGQSVVDSLKGDKRGYFLIGSDQNRYCYPVPDCDDFVELPRLDDPLYVEALLQACVARRVDVAIPGHDLELALFARHADAFRAKGASALVAPEPLVRLLRDKLEWSRHFRKVTARVVASCSVAEFRAGAREPLGFPAIAKPASGSASAGLRILRSDADLAGLADDCIIQPFLFPAHGDPELPSIRSAVAAGRVVQASEVSVQLAYSSEGELLGRFASTNRLKAGVPVEFHPLDSPEVWSGVDEVEAELEKLRPRGPVNLQGRMTDNGIVFFEMNPRFTGITGNRSLFGFNEVSLLVDNFAAGTRRKPRASRSKVGVRQVACRAWPKERFHFRSTPGRQASRALVLLGGTSWLAQHLVAERAARGDEIVVICRDASLDDAATLYSRLPAVEVVGRSSGSLRDVFAWGDVLINCVSGRPPLGDANIVDAHLYQMELLDIAEICELPRVINVSSQSVYSGVTGTAAESACVRPTTAYSFSKFAIEECVRGMSRRRPSIASVSLRLGRLFGPGHGMRQDEFPHRAVARAIEGAELEVSRPSSILNLLDVRDGARAIGFFLDREALPDRGEVYNVAGAAPISVAEYLERVDRESRKRLGRPLLTRVKEVGNDQGTTLESGKLAAAGWTASIPPERTIADLFDWFADAS